jgi:hypothetical protein
MWMVGLSISSLSSSMESIPYQLSLQILSGLGIIAELSEEEGRFVGCAPLLDIWMQSHLKCIKDRFTRPYFPENRIPIKSKTFSQVSGRDLTYSNQEWIEILSHMDDQSLVWRAPWMAPCDVIYRCGKT